MNKITVFMSSQMDEKFRTIRKEIRDKLENTGFFKVYDFDREGARSTNVKNSYLREIPKNDVVLVLIENRNGVNAGVKEEINRARLLSKKMLFIFSKEGSNDTTYLQDELMRSSPDKAEKFKEVEKNDDLIDMAVKSVKEDVITEYGDNPFSLGNHKEMKSFKELHLESGQNYKVSRGTIKDFSFILSSLMDYLGVQNNEVEDDSTLNEKQKKIIKNLLSIFLGESNYKPSKLEGIKGILLKYHDTDHHDIIAKRILSLNSYLMADIASSIEHLKEALSICDNSNNVPNWLRLDIAIDLRNRQVELNRLNNIFIKENDGQKFINKSEEPLYYPYVDREDALIYKEITHRYHSIETQSPYSTTFRNYDYIINWIGNTFISSLINVSITNMDLIRNRIIDVINLLNFEYNSNENYLEMIKLLVLNKDDKALEKVKRRYNFKEEIVTEEDLEDIIRVINNTKNDSDKFIMKLILFKNFGYYFPENVYNIFSNEIIQTVNEWIQDDYKLVSIGDLVLKSLKANVLRLNQQTLSNIILDSLDKNIIRWIEETFTILAHIDYSKVETITLERIKEIAIDYINFNEVQNSRNFQGFLIQFCKIAEIDTNAIEYLLKDRSLNFYSTDFLGEVQSTNVKQLEDFIKNELSTINEINEEQGRKGTIYGYLNKPYLRIMRILGNHTQKPNVKLFEELINNIKSTLLNPYQTNDFKIDTLNFTMYLATEFGLDDKIKELINHLTINEDKVLTTVGTSSFTNDSQRLLDFVFRLTIFSMDDNEKNFLENLFLTIEFDDYESTEALKSLSYFLLSTKHRNLHTSIYKYILQFAILKSKSTEENVRIYAARCLVDLAEVDQEETLKKVVMVMSNSTSRVKSHIFSKLKNSDINTNKYLDEIYEIAEHDKNYVVRHAIDYFNSKDL